MMNYRWKLSANFTKDKGKVFSCFACGGGSTMGYKLAGFVLLHSIHNKLP
jgi:DNA (cytosine-5)-methyltransferase 1